MYYSAQAQQYATRLT